MSEEVHLICGSDVQIAPISWLWEGWLAAGKLHIFGGPPGTGKTTVALSLAATLSRGANWPDGTSCPEPSNVLIWSGEDAVEDTLAPRLLAMSADLSRIHFVSSVQAYDDLRSFDPSRDMPLLSEKATQVGHVKLLLVDPVVTAVTGDSHKNGEVRRGLAPLVTFAEEQRTAVLGITHFTKGTAGRDPLDRLTGSLAFGAAPRVVWAASKVKGISGEDPPSVLVRVKSNIGPDGGGIRYSIESATVKHDIVASKVVWNEAMEGSAAEILEIAESVRSGTGRPSPIERATTFLKDSLAAGPRDCKSLFEDGFAEGLSEKTIRRAKKRINIDARKDGMEGGWIWSLPDDGHLEQGGQS